MKRMTKNSASPAAAALCIICALLPARAGRAEGLTEEVVTAVMESPSVKGAFLAHRSVMPLIDFRYLGGTAWHEDKNAGVTVKGTSTFNSFIINVGLRIM